MDPLDIAAFETPPPDKEEKDDKKADQKSFDDLFGDISGDFSFVDAPEPDSEEGSTTQGSSKLFSFDDDKEDSPLGAAGRAEEGKAVFSSLQAVGGDEDSTSHTNSSLFDDLLDFTSPKSSAAEVASTDKNEVTETKPAASVDLLFGVDDDPASPADSQSETTQPETETGQPEAETKQPDILSFVDVPTDPPQDSSMTDSEWVIVTPEASPKLKQTVSPDILVSTPSFDLDLDNVDGKAKKSDKGEEKKDEKVTEKESGGTRDKADSNRSSTGDQDLDFSVIELPASSLNFDLTKHKRTLSKKGSIANRKRPKRATIMPDSEDSVFQDSTEPKPPKAVIEDDDDDESGPSPSRHRDETDSSSKETSPVKSMAGGMKIPGLLEGLSKSKAFAKSEKKSVETGLRKPSPESRVSPSAVTKEKDPSSTPPAVRPKPVALPRVLPKPTKVEKDSKNQSTAVESTTPKPSQLSSSPLKQTPTPGRASVLKNLSGSTENGSQGGVKTPEKPSRTDTKPTLSSSTTGQTPTPGRPSILRNISGSTVKDNKSSTGETASTTSTTDSAKPPLSSSPSKETPTPGRPSILRNISGSTVKDKSSTGATASPTSATDSAKPPLSSSPSKETPTPGRPSILKNIVSGSEKSSQDRSTRGGNSAEKPPLSSASVSETPTPGRPSILKDITVTPKNSHNQSTSGEGTAQISTSADTKSHLSSSSFRQTPTPGRPSILKDSSGIYRSASMRVTSTTSPANRDSESTPQKPSLFGNSKLLPDIHKTSPGQVSAAPTAKIPPPVAAKPVVPAKPKRSSLNLSASFSGGKPPAVTAGRRPVSCYDIDLGPVPSATSTSVLEGRSPSSSLLKGETKGTADLKSDTPVAVSRRRGVETNSSLTTPVKTELSAKDKDSSTGQEKVSTGGGKGSNISGLMDRISFKPGEAYKGLGKTNDKFDLDDVFGSSASPSKDSAKPEEKSDTDKDGKDSTQGRKSSFSGITPVKSPATDDKTSTPVQRKGSITGSAYNPMGFRSTLGSSGSDSKSRGSSFSSADGATDSKVSAVTATSTLSSASTLLSSSSRPRGDSGTGSESGRSRDGSFNSTANIQLRGSPDRSLGDKTESKPGAYPEMAITVSVETKPKKEENQKEVTEETNRSIRDGNRNKDSPHTPPRMSAATDSNKTNGTPASKKSPFGVALKKVEKDSPSSQEKSSSESSPHTMNWRQQLSMRRRSPAPQSDPEKKEDSTPDWAKASIKRRQRLIDSGIIKGEAK